LNQPQPSVELGPTGENAAHHVSPRSTWCRRVILRHSGFSLRLRLSGRFPPGSPSSQQSRLAVTLSARHPRLNRTRSPRLSAETRVEPLDLGRSTLWLFTATSRIL